MTQYPLFIIFNAAIIMMILTLNFFSIQLILFLSLLFMRYFH